MRRLRSLLMSALVGVVVAAATAADPGPVPPPPPVPPPVPPLSPAPADKSGEVFKKVFPKLSDALNLVDKHEKLPDKTYIYGADKRSNQAKIDQLLDEAIAALEVSDLTDTRATVKMLEDKVRTTQENIAGYRRGRISAPQENTLSLIDKANPFVITKEGYDQLIASDQKNVEAYKADLEKTKATFAAKLKEIGIDVNADAVDSLLSSVSGDGFLAMTVVFHNVKAITDQLELLTQQQDEALGTAKRYYGMYVVLVRILDRVQKHFVDEIDAVHIPALEGFSRQAELNITQARALIASKGGDEKQLQSNIDSNTITQKTAQLYIKYLREQADMISHENVAVEKNLATAVNTYQTVKLSSDVANLIKLGRRNFEEMLKLRMPYLREFQNEVIKKEFRRMTEELKAGK
jgi:hypothetical protein